MSGVTLRTATLDGRPAPLGRDAQGMPTLFVQGRGRHELQVEMIAPLETSAAQQVSAIRTAAPGLDEVAIDRARQRRSEKRRRSDSP